MLNTPFGRPISSMNSAMSRAESGACSLGLSTTVQPATSAGATLAMIWLIGQFQGVMSAHTPTGSRRTSDVPIIFISAKGSETDRVVGLEGPGADGRLDVAHHPAALVVDELADGLGVRGEVLQIGVDLLPDTVVRLAAHPRIVGLKAGFDF